MSIKLSAKSYIIPLIVLLVSAVCGRGPALASDFETLERGHFIVYHNNMNLANKLSWKAEYHYKRIVNHLGVREFRPWEGESKCPIYLYKTKSDFTRATGAPEWSAGLAQYQPFRFSSYEDAQNLLIDTLPHEMVHMLLCLFMDKKPVPLWLNEGMAQFEEEDETALYRSKNFMKWNVKKGTYIKLEELVKIGNLGGMPEEMVALFYAEAASIIDHLINDNIKANFGRFIACLKSGDGLDEALKKSYQWKYKNGTADLEARWLEFVKKKY